MQNNMDSLVLDFVVYLCRFGVVKVQASQEIVVTFGGPLEMNIKTNDLVLKMIYILVQSTSLYILLSKKLLENNFNFDSS